MKRNFKGKSQLSRYRTLGSTQDAGTFQKNVLVARTKRGHQEICTRMLQMPTEQSLTLTESRRITSIGYTSRTIARNQHRSYWTSTKVKWDRCYRSHHRLIYKDNLIKGNDNEYIIERNSKNLQRQHLKTTWNTQESLK